MTIKKCDLTNLNEVADFYLKVLSYLEKTVNYPKWIPGVYPSYESVKQAIESGFQYALINAEGEVLGAVILNDDPMGNYDVGEWKTNLKTGEYMVIHTLATRVDYYKKGIAKKMVEFCIEQAKKRGYKGVRLDVVPDNYPARKLYESCGFIFAGEKNLDREYEHIPTFCLYGLDF